MWYSSPNIMSFSFIISLLFVLCCRNVEAQNYRGWKLAGADINNEIQLRDANKLDLDVWNVGGGLKIGKNHIRVNDSGIMKLYGISVANEQLICDLGNEINRERRELELPESEMGASNEFKWYSVYRKYTEIVDKLLEISNEHSAVALYSNVGITHEERAIPLLKITGTTKAEKQKVLVIGGLQAREWLGPATVVYIAQRLASLYGYDEKITSLLDQSEVHFIPLANPDGYVYSWENERLWKKNRRPNSNGSFGVDLGRNFNGTQWNARRVTSPSSNSYCGTQPFSEKETSSIRDHIRDNGPFAGAVEYGSYSQTVLRPHSYSSVPPETEPILKTIGDEWASIISRQKGVDYTSLSASSVSNVTGNARDYFFDYSHIPISFSVELRDTGASYGYMVPVSNILPTCEENFPGFTYFLRSVYNYA